MSTRSFRDMHLRFQCLIQTSWTWEQWKISGESRTGASLRNVLWNANYNYFIRKLLINTNTICAGLFEYSQFVEFQSRVAIIPDRFTCSFLKGLDICELLPFRAGGAGEAIRFLPRKWRDHKVRLERLRRFPFTIPTLSVIPLTNPSLFFTFRLYP